MNPFRTVNDAITLPFKAVFVIAICFFINWITSPGHWWVQWVVLGMGIAVISAWSRALKLAIITGLLALGGRWAYDRWGEQGKARLREFIQPPPPPAA